MKRKTKLIITILLLTLLAASALLTLCSCNFSNGVAGETDGVYYTVYPYKRIVEVHGFDKNDTGKYQIPSYIRYRGVKYPVTKLTAFQYLNKNNSVWHSLVRDGGFVVELVVPATVNTLNFYSYTSSELEKLEKITVSEDSQYFQSFDGVLYEKSSTNTLTYYPRAKADTVLTIPSYTSEIKASISAVKCLKSIEVEAGNTAFKAKDGVLYTYDGSKMLCYPAAKDDETFTIPKELTKDATSYFRSNSYLKYLKVEEGNPIYSAIDGDLYSVSGTVLLYRQAREGNEVLEINSTTKVVADGILTGVQYIYVPTNLEKFVFATDSQYYEVNSHNPLQSVAYVFFEGDSLPDFLRYTNFSGKVFFGVSREQFRLAIEGDFTGLTPSMKY